MLLMRPILQHILRDRLSKSLPRNQTHGMNSPAHGKSNRLSKNRLGIPILAYVLSDPFDGIREYASMGSLISTITRASGRQ